MENSNFTLTTTFENNSPAPQQIFSVYIYIYLYTHTHTHTYIYWCYLYTSAPLIFILSLLILLHRLYWLLREVLIALYRAERELLPLPSVLLMRAAVCTSPPCGGPPWPPLLPWPRKQKISVRSRFLSRQNYYWENVSPICPVRTFTYTPATGFELILWTCHICFLGY